MTRNAGTYGVLLVLFLSFSWSCKTALQGDLLPDYAPDTHTIIDTIIRSGDQRLESQVTLNWWGDDGDGYVAGYEFTFDPVPGDATVWSYTTVQDSTFILSTPEGEDTSNYIFSVRAIDDAGLRDPSPARLVIPVKNSPPSVVFVPGINNPQRSFPVLKFYWSGSDPDGSDNLKQFELFFNDTTGTPYVLDKTVSSALFKAEDASVTELLCDVYPNTAATPLEAAMTGLRSGQWNKLYIRAVDESDEHSPFAVSDSVYVKPVHSSVLMVDGYSTTANEDFFATKLEDNGIAVFDTMQVFQSVSGHYTQQSADNITQAAVFDLFHTIIWFSNDASNSFSLAQKTTGDFFASGGKLFMSVYISSTFDPLSNFLDFTPISSLVSPTDTTLILDTGALLDPLGAGYPTLQGTSIVGVVKPIHLQIGATPLYNAELTAKDDITLSLTPWTGISTVMAKKSDAAGHTNFVISTLELQKLDGMMNTDAFFQKVLADEFGL